MGCSRTVADSYGTRQSHPKISHTSCSYWAAKQIGPIMNHVLGPKLSGAPSGAYYRF